VHGKISIQGKEINDLFKMKREVPCKIQSNTSMGKAWNRIFCSGKEGLFWVITFF
jgi:hypothetical protein